MGKKTGNKNRIIRTGRISVTDRMRGEVAEELVRREFAEALGTRLLGNDGYRALHEANLGDIKRILRTR